MLRKKKQTPNPARRPIRQPDQLRANVFSYHASRPTFDSVLGRGTEAPSAPKIKRRLKLSWLAYAPSLIAGVALVLCLGYVSTLNTRPKIQAVGAQAKQTLVRNASAYEDEAQTVLERSLLNRSKLTIDSNKVAKELKEAFPELGDVSVILPLASRRPIIEVSPARPALVLSANGGTFVVDEKGRAVVKTNEVESSVRDALPVVQDESGIPIERGQHALPQDVVAFITTTSMQLGHKQIPVQAIVLPAVANQLHVRIEGKPYYVKFDIRGEGRQQAGTFIAVKEKLEQDGKTPGEYIDVRVPEKAFYK